MSFLDDAWGTVKKVGKDALGVGGDAVDAVVGDSDDPGLLGLSKQKVDTHTIDKNNFQNANSDVDRADLIARRMGTDARVAPTMGGTTVAPTVTAKIQQAAPSVQAQSARLGNASQTGAVRSGTSQLNRTEDQQARAYQTDLLNQLRAQAEGHGVGQDMAQQAFTTANENALKSALALAASRRGGVGGTSLGTVLDTTAMDRQKNAADLAQNKRQAVLDAQQQLAGVASGVRGQDIGVSTSDAELADAAAGRNQSFEDASNARNQSANNQFGLAQFDALNNFALNNAARSDQASQFNADLAAKTGMFNAGQGNDTNALQAQLDFQTKQNNLEAYFKQQGMNDEMAKYYTSQLLAQDEANRSANMTYEDLLTQQELGADKLDQTAFEQAANRRKQFLGDAGSVITDAAKTSDRNQKTKIKPLTVDDLYAPEEEWSFV